MSSMRFFCFLSFFCLGGFPIFSQDINFEVECGDRIESTFTKREGQGFIIELEAGDNLKVRSWAKHGDYLKYNLQLYDPAGNLLLNPYDVHGKSTIQMESGILPASGKYYVNAHNPIVNSQFRIGDYVTEFICEKSNGDIISPENKASPKKQEIVESKTQFFSVPFGTTLEGEINPGSNQLFGFKTRIEKGTEATIQFAISQGKLPLEIQIMNPTDKSIIFYSSFGEAKSMQTLIAFPNTAEYLISIKESSSNAAKANGVTKFKISLK